MILSNLNDLLIKTAMSNYLVNDAYAGDVYDINSKENKYGCFVATPRTATRTDGGTITYNYVLYFIDRLTEDEKNLDFVQSDAVSVLKGLLSFLEDEGYIQVDGLFQFTLFRHQFDDWCAGAYVEVNLIVSDDECGSNDFVSFSCDDLIRQVEELEEEVAQKNGQIVELNNEVAVKNGQIATMQEEINTLNENLETTTAALAEDEEKLNNINSIEVTKNGEYDPEDYGYYAFSNLTVNVESNLQSKSVTINKNGIV